MKSTRKVLPLVLALAASALVVGAYADPLTVTSYSMPNGGAGANNYQDTSYVPCSGACTVNSAPLSGGTGKLTDGVIPTLNWDQYGVSTPFVGWYTGFTGQTDPTITFNFAQNVAIDSVSIWVDNNPAAGVGVASPSEVVIDGQTFLITPDTTDNTVVEYTFTGLFLGNSLTMQLDQAPGQQWVMLGEAAFGGTVVPEPTTMALLATGLAVGYWRKRKAAA